MNVTFEKITEFFNEASFYLQKNESENTKFIYALKKVQKKTKPFIDEFLEGLQDIEVNNASVDKDRNLIVENEKYKFTKEAFLQMKKEKKEYIDSFKQKEFDIDVHITSEKEVPELTVEQKEAFAGFVI